MLTRLLSQPSPYGKARYRHREILSALLAVQRPDIWIPLFISYLCKGLVFT